MKEVERALRGMRVPDEDVQRAVARLVREAEADVDVGFADVDSPFGRLLVAVTSRGLLRLAYPDQEPDQVLEEVADRVSPRILRAPARTAAIVRQLGEYFEGDRLRFDVPVDWSLTGGFGRKVLRTTARIPYGDVRTYGQVATGAGSPRAYRAAGNALGANPIPIVVPCHRVVQAGGRLGGYTGGVERKEFLLRLEGALH
jgi:methylated-DNA-[protein]-cysteine S-methyltransferase